MAIILSDNLAIGVGAPIDNKYLNASNVPYSTLSEVTNRIVLSQRYQGLTVNILGVEYWFKDGVADGDLVVKGSDNAASGERIQKTFTQTGHGFSAGEVVAYSGGTFVKAIADESQEDVEIFGVITEVPNVNSFTVVFAGYVDGLTPIGLSPNTTYYLSTSVAGELSSTDTQVFGNISKPILTTLTADDALVFQYRGFVLSSGATGGGGSTSGITEIINIGAGTGEIFKETNLSISGQTSELRTLLGSGGTTIVTSGNTIIINSDSSGLYDLASPANINVGGISSGTILTGKTSNEILEELLVTTYTPTFVAPSNSFVDDAANTQEVGVTASTINFTATFNRGQIILQAAEQNKRSGLPNTYNYTGTGLPSAVTTTSLSNGQVINNYVIQAGANSWTNTVSYDEGAQPLDSNGDNFGSPLPSGTTSPKTVTINGIYPWFYGIVSSSGATAGNNRPSANQALINGGTKIVAGSNGTITVPDFNSTSDDYIWFAIPNASADKQVWYVNALNNGAIGGAVGGANLFPNEDVVSVDSPDGFWSGIDYKIYISNVQTTASNMEFRNS